MSPVSASVAAVIAVVGGVEEGEDEGRCVQRNDGFIWETAIEWRAIMQRECRRNGQRDRRPSGRGHRKQGTGAVKRCPRWSRQSWAEDRQVADERVLNRMGKP